MRKLLASLVPVRAVTIVCAIGSGAFVIAAGQLPPKDILTDITTRAGITFVRSNGATGSKWYPELFGGGVAVLDVDSDGWPDLLFVNGKDWIPSGRRSFHGLYRNNGDGTFRDVAAGSGLDGRDVFGIGVSVADYDNDGRDDLYITAIDGDLLFHNEGSGRFADVTERSGIRNANFAVSSAWLDYDRDGLVDLFVGNYVQWSPSVEPRCSSDGVTKGFCGPESYKGVAPKLYRNLGTGRFDDVTVRAGLDDPTNKAMGVAVLDYNMDGWPDLFVANDRVPAKLYRNDGHGRFVEEGLRAGVALSEQGAARGNMGVDAADYDRSGRPHLLVGNFFNEMLGLYHNNQGGVFADVAPRTTVGRASLLSVTWAVFFLDYDLDGFLDIFAANGGTDESQAMLDSRARLSQPPLLLRNNGNRTFDNLTAAAGETFARPMKARGAAYADIDGDGDLDIAVATLDGPAFLFRNDRGNRNNWLRVRAVGSRSNRSGIGTLVRVTSASGTQWQMVHSGSSYASQSELTLTFGLGRDTSVSALEVVWPSGAKQTFADVRVNQQVIVDEDKGLQFTDRPRGRFAPGASAPPR